MESKIDIAKRCYPIGTKYLFSKTEYLSSGEFTGNDSWVGRADCNGGFILEESDNKWAKLILPEPEVGMRVQHGPESNPDVKNGKISGRSKDGTRVDVRWDDGSCGTFDYGNKGVIPVTPEFDTGKKIEEVEDKVGWKVRVSGGSSWVNAFTGVITAREGTNDTGGGLWHVLKPNGTTTYHYANTFERIEEPKKLFTIQDLADGKCAVENDGTKSQLNDVLRVAFPGDSLPLRVSHKFYVRLNKDEWKTGNRNRLPTQSVKDFVLKSEIEPLNPWVGGIDTNQEIEVGDTVECIDNGGTCSYYNEKAQSMSLTKWEKGKCPENGGRYTVLGFHEGYTGIGDHDGQYVMFGLEDLKLIKKGASSQPVSENKTNIKEEYHGKVQNIIEQEQRSSGQGRVVIQSRRKRATVVSGHLSYKKVFVSSKKKVSIG